MGVIAVEEATRVVDELDDHESRLDELYERILGWLPYVTLALSTVLSLVLSDRPWSYRLVTLAVALAAATWVYLTYTRLGPKAEAPAVALAVYFVVMLAFGAYLMFRDGLFFIFVITGFMHAGVLRPFPAVVAGVGASSVVINSGLAGTEGGSSGLESLFVGDVSADGVATFTVIVLIQTLAISGGFLMGEKIFQLSRQRKEALAAKEAALAENAGLHMQLMTQAREAGMLDERQRVAREIHDTVAQGLAGIITQLHAADGSAGEDERRRHLDSAADLARRSLAEARRTVQAIGPPTLAEAHLPDALAEESSKWSANGGVPVEFTATGEARPMHPEIEVTLLRTAQEALANVGKHAEAGRVGITLSYMDDQVALDVRDDGVGFEPSRVKSNVSGGFGLAAMRQRVARLAGSVSIESAPGGGTVVSVSLPAVPKAVVDAR
ncbi:sensor histidine kinase [Glycomyces salinus]|uniref:sensor histidine kinase n=1 Tax=Glycomyces salinus TaxID=980294 RepID=UPI0018EAE7DB|nr:sensor histidine kinase [Glycomyces salinus]